MPPDEVGKIADVYCDIEDYDKALELEQMVISKWPKSNSIMVGTQKNKFFCL